MCYRTVAVYCFTDDFFKARGHRKDCRTPVTDAEIIAIAITAMLDFGGNFEKIRVVFHELGFIKRLLSRSRFSRRVNRLTDLINCLFYPARHSPQIIALVIAYPPDSFPLPGCDNILINRCRLVCDELYRGKISSNRRYFYGVKVQLLTTSDDFPVKFCILPGGCADLQELAELPLSLSDATQLFVD
jgi:hypothetical protein